MKTYIGVKRIQAEPCERNGEPGYWVRYEDGRDYDTWFPAEIFERTYMKIERPDKLTALDIERFVTAGKTDIATLGEKTTSVLFTAPTGFVLSETSACVRPENYDESIGATICKERIEGKLWEHLGFVLQWADGGLKK